MINTKRVEWVDIIKYICIMFVMLSHLETNTEIMKSFYTPFCLTGFFFVSGYVYRQPESFVVLLKKKSKGLLLPWFIFSNLNILASQVISFKANRCLKTEVLKNLLQIRGYGDGLWFVAALFVAFIPFYYVVKIENRNIAVIFIFILSFISKLYVEFFPKNFFPWGKAALPWHLEYIFQAMLWMLLGYYFKGEVEEFVDSKNTRLNRFILLFVYLVLIAFLSEELLGKVGWIAASYIISLLGVLLLIMLSKVLKTNNYIEYVGANTLIYFALHGKLYAVVQRVLKCKAGTMYCTCLHNIYYSIIISVLITILLSLILIIPSFIINRWFPWMVGRKAAKKA
ncbi:Fucose 4-O-acetylase [Pseudobutyrivibrio sp. YE44]|uniref:acyltransferase family protein n=1 Tax=Pseudobutyrivibrio sp. YE44 TaxID=1520802 RepID=UPI00087E2907|nr:acyltransferase family protein [Pseudobutyrivibrio sp. YE44]SDB46788.1 Fucose 4-O-acetylase [Pseudobutyrivibrio sp. YE44]